MIWDVDKEKVVDCTTPMTYEEYKRMTNQYCRNVAHKPMTKLCNSCEYLKYCARSGIEEVGCDRYKRDMTTNEEWLKSCNAEQLATFLAIVQYDGTDLTLKKNHVEKWVAWLKQPHREEKHE